MKMDLSVFNLLMELKSLCVSHEEKIKTCVS